MTSLHTPGTKLGRCVQDMFVKNHLAGFLLRESFNALSDVALVRSHSCLECGVMDGERDG